MNQSKVSALKLFQPAPLCPDPREMPFSEVSLPLGDLAEKAQSLNYVILAKAEILLRVIILQLVVSIQLFEMKVSAGKNKN
jgi:hypothetical protein